MEFESIKTKIEEYQRKGLRLFTTSSFQTHSIVLLHMLSKIDKSIPVYCINTGYHFPETIRYRDEVVNLLGLNLVNVTSQTPRHMQKDAEGRLLFTSDPDYCCFINKVLPMDPVLANHDVWINGVRADQSAVRKEFNIEEKAKFDTIRFHPMLDWTGKMIHGYLREHHIPKHPLEDQGYMSIGCEPCTRKMTAEMVEREARWYGLNKTECGLNTELGQK